MKRLIAGSMLAALFLSLAACGSEKDVPEVMPHQDFASQEEESAIRIFSAAPEQVEYPLEEENAAISITFPYASDLALQGDQGLLAAWQEATGVAIEPDPIPWQDYNKTINSYVSTMDLADVTVSVDDYLLGEDVEAYLELSELLEENAPNYLAAVNALPGGPGTVTEDDGTLWRMYQLYDSPQLLDGFGLMLRQDYLEQLGMEPPETYEEYHDYFLAVKDAFQPDQPFRMLPNGVTYCNNFSAGFGISLGSKTYGHGFYQVEGQVHYGALEPGFTEYLTLLHDWYQEGILNSQFLDFAEVGSNSYLIDLANHSYGAFFLPLSSCDTLLGMCDYPITPGMDPVKESEEMTHLAAAPAAICYGPGFSISATAEEPALVVRALDWLYTEEGFYAASYGREGETYTVQNGIPEFTESIQENGQSLEDAILANTGDSLAGRMAGETRWLKARGDLAVLETWNRQKDTAYMIPECTRMTQEESEDYTARAVDISTYVDSVIPQFILGEKPLEELPEVQEKVRELGIENCLALWQTALDRSR